MTSDRNFKRLVRARMAETGERYASARRAVLRELEPSTAPGYLHLGGTHPDCTALRVLLANAGVVAPHSGEVPSEDLILGIAGGPGTAVMAFRYEREDVSTFWLSGWNVFQSSILGACERLGLTPAVTETTGARTAAAQLRDLLDLGVPAIAWADAAELGYLGLPPEHSGGAETTVVVYRDGPDGSLVGDRALRPIELPPGRLATARARIRRLRNRLLSLGQDEVEVDLAAAAERGLAACAAGPVKPPAPGMTVDGLRLWAERLADPRGRNSWATVFPPGPHLWTALRAVHDHIEHQGSGGGLMRPAFARFLREAGVLSGRAGLEPLAGRYDELGGRWRGLAAAALPADVPVMATVAGLLAEREDRFRRDGAGATARLAEIEAELRAIAAGPFPLGTGDVAALRRDLAARVTELYELELAAQAELARVAAPA
jgi:hypothetical protein